MKIGIVGAMAQEVEILSDLMTEKVETRIASAVIFEGKINGKKIALLQSGIGKVAAAIGTTALLQIAQPDVVINIEKKYMWILELSACKLNQQVIHL